MLNHRSKGALRAIALAAVAGLAVTGLAATGAGAQTSSDPGVTDKDVTIGYISSQTGVAAATHKNAHKSCQARVDAQNAKGGVNSRLARLVRSEEHTSELQ